jgi:hypothetical protein
MNPTQTAAATDESAIVKLMEKGLAAAEVAERLGVAPSTLKMLQKQMHSLLSSAVESGVPVAVLADFAGAEIRPFIDEDIRAAYATPEEGLSVLLKAEGGCVSVSQACGLFRKPKPVSRQTLTAQIRKGSVIGYLTGGDHYVVPVWQFRREGGVIEGLAEILNALRAKVPGFGQISPFTFFLQADPVTDGRTPLAALRDGNIQKVLNAVDARIA